MSMLGRGCYWYPVHMPCHGFAGVGHSLDVPYHDVLVPTELWASQMIVGKSLMLVDASQTLVWPSEIMIIWPSLTYLPVHKRPSGN